MTSPAPTSNLVDLLPPAWGDGMTAKSAPARSPRWWVERLYKALQVRIPEVERFAAYYSGDHPLPFLAEQAQAEFRRILKMTRSNYMGLVVDARVQRLTTQGFRIGGNTDGDAEAWRIWQANNCDRQSKQAYAEAYKSRRSFWLAAPNPDDAKTPLITVEHPSQAIVAYEPGSSTRRAAGFKLWVNDWVGDLEATLYLPGWLFKLRAPWDATRSDALPTSVRWEPRTVVDEPWPVRNPLGAVPLVEMPYKPDLLGVGVSLLGDVTDIQDRINKTVADRLMTQDWGAFPQKWAAGWEIEDDETTGQPKQTVNVGRNRLIQAESADTKFGQWDAAPLDPYSNAKREDVKDIASRTQTPAQYLLGELTNVNGETLKAAESGLVSAILDDREPFADAQEEVMRLAFRLAGDRERGSDMGAETIWRNPEFRTEGELVAALATMHGMGLPMQAVYERWGASPEEIRRYMESDMSNPVNVVKAQLELAQRLQTEQGLSQPAALMAVGLLQAGAQAATDQGQTPPGAGQ